MAAFLFTWNPKKTKIDADFEEWSERTRHRGRTVSLTWQCMNPIRIKDNDRAFIMRLGQEPKGIVASGSISGGAFLTQGTETARGRYEVAIKADTVLDALHEPILTLSTLVSELGGPAKWWTPQRLSTHIEDEIADGLKKLWEPIADWHRSKARMPFRLPEEDVDEATLIEGGRRRIVVNAFERNPMARRLCIAHHGSTCAVCDVDLRTVYGPVATDLVHVHHRVPQSKIRKSHRVDPVKDLVPVCPNCHAVIHRHDPPYEIPEMRRLIARYRIANVLAGSEAANTRQPSTRNQVRPRSR